MPNYERVQQKHQQTKPSHPIQSVCKFVIRPSLPHAPFGPDGHGEVDIVPQREYTSFVRRVELLLQLQMAMTASSGSGGDGMANKLDSLDHLVTMSEHKDDAEEEDDRDLDEESDADNDDDDDDESKAGTAESLCTRFPRFKGEEPIKLATKTAQERQEVVRLTGILTNPLDAEGAHAVAQLASTSESWKQQRTRRNLTLRKLVEQLRDSRIAELLKKQDGGTLFAYNKSDEYCKPHLDKSTSDIRFMARFTETPSTVHAILIQAADGTVYNIQMEGAYSYRGLDGTLLSKRWHAVPSAKGGDLMTLLLTLRTEATAFEKEFGELLAEMPATAAPWEDIECTKFSRSRFDHLTRSQKAKGGLTGGPSCPKVAAASAELQAAKQAEAEAAASAAATPDDDPAAKAAAVRAAAVATAAVLKKQAALDEALLARQVTAQGRADGGRNGRKDTQPTGPESQSCRGCGFTGGSWRTCPRNDKRSAGKAHEDGQGSPGKRRSTARKNSDVYAERLGSSVASSVEPPLPKRQRQSSLADLFQK